MATVQKAAAVTGSSDDSQNAGDGLGNPQTQEGSMASEATPSAAQAASEIQTPTAQNGAGAAGQGGIVQRSAQSSGRQCGRASVI